MIHKHFAKANRSVPSSIIRHTFFNSSLAFKFKVIYFVIILLCIFSNTLMIHQFYLRQVKNAITSLEAQTIETVSKNVDNSLKTVSKTSTYLLGTSDIQKYLQSNSPSSNTILAKNLRNALYLTLESMPLASSILIINENGSYEGAGRYILPDMILDSPQKASWYKQLHELKGESIFLINGGGYFKVSDGNNYISLIRLINSTETARPLGYMMINISMNSLLSFAQENNSYSDICVFAQGKIILASLNEPLNNFFIRSSPETLPPESDVIIDQKRYLILNFQDSTYNLNYLSAIKYDAFSNETKPFLVIFIAATLISATLFLFIAFFTNQFITSPLKQLMYAMSKTKDGNLKHISVTKYQDEIGLLQETYNDMVDKVQNLLESKIYEQKLLRKAELNTLHEQIKPHFLYNSLSAIAYLISSNQNNIAYDMIISLSEYYRESLSKGNEIVSLSTEITIVKNYLMLQKMRFPDMFDDIYDIQTDTLDYPIPRLILQPLVENALYHGIIPTCEFGTIKIHAFTKNSCLQLSVSDNGIGIAPDQLTKIMGDKLKENAMSFGLRGTVERLQIYYDTKSIYQIKSTPNIGTEIIFSLPLERMEEYNEQEQNKGDDC